MCKSIREKVYKNDKEMSQCPHHQFTFLIAICPNPSCMYIVYTYIYIYKSCGRTQDERTLSSPPLEKVLFPDVTQDVSTWFPPSYGFLYPLGRKHLHQWFFK